MAYGEKIKKESKIFNVTSKKEWSEAEKYQNQLFKKYNLVKVRTIGFDKISIEGENK
jgi:hypothetical protein